MTLRNFLRLLARLPAVAALGLVVGCAGTAFHNPVRRAPVFIPENYSGVVNLPAELRRVLLLPLSGGAVVEPEMTAAFDAVFATALQKERRFEVVVLSREECLRRFGVGEVSSSSALPHNFMTVLRRDYAADAVLFVDLTAFSAYRPLVLGVRAKLATAEEVRLLWSFDTVFSAADAAVANSARQYMLKRDRATVPADLSSSVLQSPSQFGEYAAAATFATLPPVYSATPKIGVVSR